jgi:hypothetical protein
MKTRLGILAVGRTFSSWGTPGNRRFGEHKRMQAVGAAIGAAEALLEFAGGHSALVASLPFIGIGILVQ